MRTVFAKALHDQRRALVGWSIGILGLVLLEVALWPTVRDMPDLTEMVAGYPEPMRKLSILGMPLVAALLLAVAAPIAERRDIAVAY